MIPRKMLATLSLCVAFAAPAYAVDVTVFHTGLSPEDGSASSDQQTASLSESIEFAAVGSYFVDFEPDGEAFVMIVQDDIAENLSPLSGADADEYRFVFPASLGDVFAIVDEGSASGLADYADVEIDGNALTVSFLPGATFESGDRLVVSIDDLTDQYHDGDIDGEGDSEAGTDG